jgi:hypothetical protein
MTIHNLVSPLGFEQILSKDPSYELKSHPAFYPQSTKKYAETLLLGTLPMTYILWTPQVVNDEYHLSYMKTNMTVEHLNFGYTTDWHYMNCDTYHAATLSDLIPQIMQCQQSECKMLLNPRHYHKYEC